MRKAIDEADADGVDNIHEHQRHIQRGPLFQRHHGREADGQDDIRRERSQFRRIAATAVGIDRTPVGALAPLAIGWVISVTGSFDAGFLVLVGAALLGGAALLPLMRRY